VKLFIAVPLLCGVLPAQVSVIYDCFDPPVIPLTHNAPVTYSVRVTGSPARVSLETAGRERELHDDGRVPDVAAGDNVWSISLPAADIVSQLRPDDVYRVFVGYLRARQNTGVAGPYNIFAAVSDAGLPRLPVRSLAADAQVTPNLVNVADPGFFRDDPVPYSFDVARIARRFYQLLPDDFDFLVIVSEQSYFQNRHFISVRNDVRGIGLGLSDRTAAHGSRGRLRGVIMMPNRTFFDGAETGYQHEIGHNWIAHLNFAPFSSGSPHWPISSLATGIMGFSISSGDRQGGTFPCRITREAGGLRISANTAAAVFTDMDLYLMGLLPASSVGEHYVLADQTLRSCSVSSFYAGAYERVTTADIVNRVGPRIPDSDSSPKDFRVANVIVSRELLPPDALAFYDWFAARASYRIETQVHSGFLKQVQKPWYLATDRRSTLNTAIFAAAGPVIAAPPVHAATYRTPIPAGGFFTIYGRDFVSEAVTWDGAIEDGGVLPQRLGEAEVTVAGRKAWLSYAGPGQINALAPDDLEGIVAISVSTPAGASSTSAEISRVAPGFFTWQIGERLFLAAQFANDGVYVARVGALPSVVSRPARQGDHIQLYATGLGATAPAAPQGRVLERDYPLASRSLSVTIGGRPAIVMYAGLTFAGVFQINVQVPAGVPAGDQAVVLTIDGRSTQPGVLLSIDN
jgi:uncharacterized protein (TIGR03437 family)